MTTMTLFSDGGNAYTDSPMAASTSPAPDAPSPFDALRHVDPELGEFWTGRDIHEKLGYSSWQKFEAAVTRARNSITNIFGDDAGPANITHTVNRVRRDGTGYVNQSDYRLTRHGAYILVMNADPKKTNVALAQHYFAARTREAELAAAAPASPFMLDPRNLEHVRALATSATELAKRIEELEPDARMARTFLGARGDFSLGETCAYLMRDPTIRKKRFLDSPTRGIGQNRLFELMRMKRWEDGLEMVGDADRPYQRHITHVVLRVVVHNDFGVETRTGWQLRVTPLGLRYLHKVLGGTDKDIRDEFPR